MAETQQIAGGLSGALGGAAAGFTIGGPVGAVFGGALGLVSGLFGGGSDRAQFRAQRKSEFFRNAALRLQAAQSTRVAGRLQSQQRVAAGAAGIRGATVTQIQLQSLIDANRQRTALLAGVSDAFQSGGGRTRLAEAELPGPAARSVAREHARRNPQQTPNTRRVTHPSFPAGLLG